MSLQDIPSEISGFSIGNFLTEVQKSHRVNKPLIDKHSVERIDSRINHPAIISMRRPSVAAYLEKTVENVTADLLKDSRSQVEVFDQKGIKFDSAAYLLRVIEKSKQQVGKCQGEIKQLDMVIAELEGVMQRVKEEKRQLIEIKTFLKQKKWEHQDIMNIRERRYQEIRKLKDKLYSKLLTDTAESGKSYLSSGISYHREKKSNIQEICWKTSVLMADRNDPEVVLLIDKIHRLRNVLDREQRPIQFRPI